MVNVYARERAGDAHGAVFCGLRGSKVSCECFRCGRNRRKCAIPGAVAACPAIRGRALLGVWQDT